MNKLSVFAFAAIAAASVFGGSVAWIGGDAEQPNAWGVGANWEGGALPGADDTADFSDVNGGRIYDAESVTWNITAAPGSKLDVSQAKVVREKTKFYLSGVRNYSGLMVIIR